MSAADVVVDGQKTPWGLSEATLAWITSTFLGGLLLLPLVQLGGFSVFTPERPGGHLGRAVGQFATEQELVNRSIPVAWQLALLFPMWILLLGTPWIFAAILRRDRPGWSLHSKLGDVPLGIGAGVLLQIPLVPIVVVLMRLVFGEFESSDRALTLVQSAASSPFTLVLLIVCVAIGAPLVEELFYRGLVQPALIRATNVPIGIGVASLIFGAVHFSLVELLPLSVVGLVFGILAHRTGRLMPAIIAHMTFNAFTLTAILATTAFS